MNKESKNSTNIRFNNFIEDLANFVSSDKEEALFFLEENSIDLDSHVSKDLKFIEDAISQSKLEEGQNRQTNLKKLKEYFQKYYQGLSVDQQNQYKVVFPQVSFNRFDENGLGPLEVSQLCDDASFLKYLDENEFLFDE